LFIELLLEYGLFLAKATTIVAAFLITSGGLIALLSKEKSHKKGQLEIKDINEKYQDFSKTFQQQFLPKHEFKKIIKKETSEKKIEQKKQKKGVLPSKTKRLFSLTFHGDIRASATDSLREEISAILMIADQEDEVLVRLESGGGMVHSYGLAASQLQRIRDRGIALVVSVDKIAASGGYMIASVANKIIAAPFAVIGSIGVVMQLPNFNRLLKQHNIDFEQITAGDHKRSLTLFGENSDQDRKKVEEELQETHDLFKDFILKNRANLDIEKVATGEHWYGSTALDLGLIDEIMTSDDYLMTKRKDNQLFEISYSPKKNFLDKLPFRTEKGSKFLQSISKFPEKLGILTP